MPYPVVPPALPPVAADVSAAPLQMTSVEASIDSAEVIQLSPAVDQPDSVSSQFVQTASQDWVERADSAAIADSVITEATAPQLSQAVPPISPLPEAAPSTNRSVWKDGVVRPTAPLVEPTDEVEPGDIEQPEIPDVTDVPGEEPESADTPVQIRANQQEYDQIRQVVSAYGNVVLTLPDAVLDADRLWVNLNNRITVAEGNVALVRGDQVIRGGRAEYNLLQSAGTVFDAAGVLFLPTLDDDLSTAEDNDVLARSNIPLSTRATSYQPVGRVTNPTNLEFGTEGDNQVSASALRRLRFETEQIDVNAEGWQAQQIRLTNDPFSPPELEFRANSARLTRISEFQDELVFDNGRVVFDQGFSLPLPRSRFIINRGEVESDEFSLLPTDIGIDNRDRDGLFVGRDINLINSGTTKLQVTPEFYLGRFFDNSEVGSLENFGFVTRFTRQFGPDTELRAVASVPGLDLSNIDDRLRASTRLRQALGSHTLALEASYRNRLFNGSLGFQNVQSSVGAVLSSPVFQLGDTGINLSYQLGGQYVTANTDLARFIDPGDDDNRRLISLGRFQAGVFLSKSFLLWQGEGLPATPDQGLRYTPTPVVPYVVLFTGLRGVGTYYTDGSLQETLAGTVGVDMQFGHFSRPYLDYTRINLAYSENFARGDQSPFLFDRDADQRRISFGIIQQIYGPFRAGIQTSFNLDNSQPINLDYILEYSRRTYGVIVRYNSTQNSGFVGFRLSNFDYSGDPGPLGGGARRVEGGVIQ
ncbi:MAG: DUF3769 domain-containing protein [Leptolyngbya sp. SIO4C5]|nr:DUF3769 domain-containing protein [Leptolyngbya sp. SIO4C5]